MGERKWAREVINRGVVLVREMNEELKGMGEIRHTVLCENVP